MHSLPVFASESLSRLTVSLGHFLWQGILIALVAAGISALLRRDAARMRYAVHAVALACMGICLPATFLMVTFRTSSETSAVTAATGVQEALASAQAIDLQRPLPDVSVNEQFGSIWSLASPHIAQAYLFGMTLMWLRFTIAVYGGRRLRRCAVPIDDHDLVAIIVAAASRVGLRRVPDVAFCRLVSGPVVVGVIRPVVLIPISLGTGLSPSQFHAIIMHEFAHIRRYDYLILMLQRTVESLLFFHPAVWYISRQLSTERENCCDDAVLAAGSEPVSYVQALLHVAELGASHRKLADLACRTSLAAVGRGESRLRRRIVRLIGAPAEPHIRVSRMGIILMLLAATSLLLAPSMLPKRNQTRAASGDEEPDRPARTPLQKPPEQPAENEPTEPTPPRRLGFLLGADGAILVDEKAIPPSKLHQALRDAVDPGTLEVSITKDGVILVEGEAVPPSKLMGKLRDAVDDGVTHVLLSEEHKRGQSQVVAISILIKMAEALHASVVPPKEADTNASKPQKIVVKPGTRITISRSGEIRVNGKIFEIGDLRKLKLSGKKVAIRVDQNATYLRLGAVLNALQAAGAAEISFATASIRETKETWESNVEILEIRKLSPNSYLRFPESVERAMMGEAMSKQRPVPSDPLGSSQLQGNFPPTPLLKNR